MKLKEMTNKIKEVLESEPSVIAGYLFGSLAKELENFGGDIDIAVLLQDGDNHFYLKKERDITMELSDALNRDDIDLTIANVAPIELAFEIIKGKLLYSKDNKKRILFEEKAILDYIDFKPYIDEYNKFLRERLKKGA